MLSLIRNWEMQIKTTMNSHFIPTRLKTTKKPNYTSVGKDTEWAFSHTANGNINLYSYLCNNRSSPFKEHVHILPLSTKKHAQKCSQHDCF